MGFIDAIVIEANASRYHGKAPDEIDWLAPERQTHAVAEFLAHQATIRVEENRQVALRQDGRLALKN